MAAHTSAATKVFLAAAVMLLAVPAWSQPSIQNVRKPPVEYFSSSTKSKRDSRIVLVIAGGISIRDIAQPGCVQFARLFREGSAALMNVRTGKPTQDTEPVTQPGMLPGCLSLGSGAMASGGAEVARAYDALSYSFDRGALPGLGVASGRVPTTFGEVYALRTGRRWSPKAVYHIEIIKIKRINDAAAYRAAPGLLGTTLRRAGIRTAVVGNSDILSHPQISSKLDEAITFYRLLGRSPWEIHREAVAVAMDQWGMVDGGTVSSADLTEPDPNSAYGIRTNTAALLKYARAALHRSRFLVVDFGDTFRADLYAQYCSDERGAELRKAAVFKLDRFIGELRKLLDSRHDLLIVLSPCTRTFSEFEQERLAPILIVGPGFAQGLLRSPSTRRTGVVTLIDVAPTVLRFFGLDVPNGMVGRPITSLPSKKTAEELLNLNLQSIKHAERLSAMRGGSVFQAIVVVVATIGLLFAGGSVRTAAAWCAVIPAIMPLTMLFLTPIYSGGLAGSVLILTLGTGAILLISIFLLRSPARALAWVCGMLAASLLCDLALGSPLGRTSIAGYSLVEGARYYGLGNELMGSLLGATLVAAAFVSANGSAPTLLCSAMEPLIFLGVFLFIGLPSLGANGGGSIAAAVAFITVLAVKRHWRPSLRGIGVLTLCVLGAVIAVFVLDAIRAGQSQSHLGRVLESVIGGNWHSIVSIASRKIQLNFMLMSTSLWSRLLIVSLIASALLYWAGRLQGAGARFRAFVFGLVVATVAAFLFNDSGVVAAAACAVLMWSTLAVTFYGRSATEVKMLPRPRNALCEK